MLYSCIYAFAEMVFSYATCAKLCPFFIPRLRSCLTNAFLPLQKPQSKVWASTNIKWNTTNPFQKNNFEIKYLFKDIIFPWQKYNIRSKNKLFNFLRFGESEVGGDQQVHHILITSFPKLPNLLKLMWFYQYS